MCLKLILICILVVLLIVYKKIRKHTSTKNKKRQKHTINFNHSNYFWKQYRRKRNL